MGACLSFAAGGTKSVLEAHDGSQEEFDARFTTSQVLGEGEFGQVKLVVDSKNQTSYACKTLRKGAVLKDNCLYPPLPPGTLRGEVEMLQKLKGEHYCLKLVAVYETPRAVLVVTDCCLGGEMMVRKTYYTYQHKQLQEAHYVYFHRNTLSSKKKI